MMQPSLVVLLWLIGLEAKGRLIVKPKSKRRRFVADARACNWTALEFNGRVLTEKLEMWNSMSSRGLSPPCAVIEPWDTSGVQAAVRFATSRGWKLRIHGGGHDYLQHSTWNGAVLTTRRLRRIKVQETIQMGAGTRWRDAYAALDAASYVAGGLGPEVGVVGFTLGGGINHGFCRRYGLAADNLVAATVVTAKGQVVVASKHSNRDLFWALRGGGGGNFGVVTEVEFRKHEGGGGIQYFFHLDNALAALRWLQTFGNRVAIADTRLGLDAHCYSADEVVVTLQWNLRDETEDFADYLSIFANRTLDWHLDRACEGVAIRPGSSWWVETACSRTAGAERSLLHSKPLDAIAQTSDNWFVDFVSDDLLRRALEVQAAATREIGARFVLCLEFFFNCTKENTAFAHHDSWFWYWECFAEPGRAEAACESFGTNLSLATDRLATIKGSYTNYNVDKYARALDLFYGRSLSGLRRVKRAWDPTDFFRHEKSIPIAMSFRRHGLRNKRDHATEGRALLETQDTSILRS